MPDHKATLHRNAHRKRCIAANLCSNCGKNPLAGTSRCRQCLDALANNRAAKKARAECRQCGRPSQNSAMCSQCRTKRAKASAARKLTAELRAACNICRKARPTKGLKTCHKCRIRRKKNHENWQTRQLAAGRCTLCGHGKLYDKRRCRKCVDKHANKRQRLKTEVFNAYGRRCKCCGENEEAFLQIDHINGGGRQHLKQIGTAFYAWLKRRNFPQGFQTLCCNCNFAKAQRGVCPHQLNRPSGRPR